MVFAKKWSLAGEMRYTATSESVHSRKPKAVSRSHHVLDTIVFYVAVSHVVGKGARLSLETCPRQEKAQVVGGVSGRDAIRYVSGIHSDTRSHRLARVQIPKSALKICGGVIPSRNAARGFHMASHGSRMRC